MINGSTNFINWAFFCTLDNVHAILYFKNSYELLRIIFIYGFSCTKMVELLRIETLILKEKIFLTNEYNIPQSYIF